MKQMWLAIIWIGYVGLIGLTRFSTDWWWWGFGCIVAGLLIIIDRLLYVWWLAPFEQLSIQSQYCWRQKQYIESIRLVFSRGKEQTKLLLTSIGFAVVWPFLAIYVLSSTGSAVGAGVVMALGLRLVLALLLDWQDPVKLERWFTWQIKRTLSEREIKIIAGVFVGVWILVTAWVVLG
jgi:hypothetical protein